MILSALVLAATLTSADIPRMQVAELHAAMQKGEAVAIDVRGSVPHKYGHITGAVWMPLGLIRERWTELPQDKTIVAYCTCKAEETSLEGAVLLASLGFPKVAVLQGGYPAWKQAGLPVTVLAESDPAEPVPPGVAEPPAPAASPSPSGRLAPPTSLHCDRNQLTMYEGRVTAYRRAKNRTTLTIETTSGTTEHVTLEHPGSDDPSAGFLLQSQPFTKKDWSRIESRKGRLRPGLTVLLWLCETGTRVVDWRPGQTRAGNE